MEKIKQYVLDTFEKEEMKSIVKHGMVAGFAPLIYYRDTVDFHDKYEEEIWSWLWQEADDCGYKNIIELIHNFNGSKDVGGMDQLKNLLCWAAIEKICFDICEEEALV